jgi:4-amino-4-deoxy-L-arabinose transferase-like glycosyltransferase
MATRVEGARGLNMPWGRPWVARWGIPLLIFVIALVPRIVYPVSRPVNWSDRAFHFSNAILERDWGTTYQRYHPGVTLMWLAGAGLQLFSRQQGGLTGDQLLGIAPTKPGTLTASVSAAIIPLGLAIAFCIALSYPLLCRLAGRRVGLVASLLVALDPFHIAYSKVIHPDGLLTVFMFLSGLFLLAYLREGRRQDLVLSGITGGLAFLTKSPSFFLVPYVGLIGTATYLFPDHGNRSLPRRLVQVVKLMVVWLLIAAAVFVLLWPAMWVKPGDILGTMADRIVFHTTNPHRNPVFFNGRITEEDPGIIYYLAAIGWKTTMITLPFIGIALLWLLGRWRSKEGRILLALFAYAIFFTLQMGIGQFKQVAYILPVAPVLSTIAAFGLVWSAEALASLRWIRKLRWFTPVLLSLALLVQAAIVVQHHPYLGIHYNLLLGGLPTAAKVLPLQDHGEGLDIAGRYLSTLEHGQDETALIYPRSAAVFRREFIGRTTTDIAPWATYRVYYINEEMRQLGNEDWQALWQSDQQSEPLLTVTFDGIPFVWVYGDPPADPVPDGPDYEIKAQLGDHIWLERVRIGGEKVSPGETLTVALYWRSDGLVREDYTVFAHLLSADGSLVAQRDQVPLFGIRPVWTWRDGELLEDVYHIPIPADAIPGVLELSAGMYESQSMQRLVARDAQGNALPENRIPLGLISVEPAEES